MRGVQSIGWAWRGLGCIFQLQLAVRSLDSSVSNYPIAETVNDRCLQRMAHVLAAGMSGMAPPMFFPNQVCN